MTYTEMVDKVLNAFDKLEGEKQRTYVRDSLQFVLTDSLIFPMKELGAFCKEYFCDDYQYLLSVMENTYTNNRGGQFHLNDEWVLWIPEETCEDRFLSASKPFDFVKLYEQVMDDLIEEIFMDKNGLKILGFSEAEEKEIQDAYDQNSEEMTRELTESFFPEDEEENEILHSRNPKC